MGFLLTGLVSLLSLFKIGDIIGTFLIKNKKYVSIFLYILVILSFLFFTDNSNHAIKETGEKAIALLWFILFLPILAKVFNFSLAKKLMIFRKELGILMGVLAMIHSLKYFILESAYQFWEYNFWISNGSLTYLSYGFIAMIIAIILTITSNNYFLKKMGKHWKTLHRTVYILLIFTLLHVIFLKIGGKNGNKVLFENGIPFIIYIIGKTLEWKKIVLLKAK